HAQAALDWGLAAQLLADNWYSLQLDGQAATTDQLLAGFPAGTRTADAELAVLAAAEELAHGSLEAAERYLGLAERGMASGPDARSAQAHPLLGITPLGLARQRSDRAAGAGKRWPARHGSCRPWPRPRMRRSLAWARNCAHWR